MLGGNMQQMLKQAQELQKKMAKAQEEMEKKYYEVSSGGDMVKLKINGKMEIQEIKIAKEIVDPEDIEMLEDLVLSCVKEGIKKVQDDQKGQMSNLTGGLNIPGLS